MREVALKAGVSSATVSYVLNGRSDTMRIAVETRERILDAVRELGYHPNAIAQSLSHKRTHAIAVVMQYPALFSGWSGFINTLMHGVTDSAVKHGYDLMLHTRNAGLVGECGEGSAIEREVAILSDGRVDGALLLRDRNDLLAAELKKRGLPVVLMFTGSEQNEIPFVDCDNVLGGKIATEYLIELGHRRIVHLAGSVSSTAAYDRRTGYNQIMQKQGAEATVLEIASPLSDFLPLLECFEKPKGQRPTALFAWSDDVAITAIRLLREKGIRVPEDVSVIGFDSTELCNHTAPPLTSVRQPIYAMADNAVTLLTQQIRGEAGEMTLCKMAPEIVVRDSCSPLLERN